MLMRYKREWKSVLIILVKEEVYQKKHTVFNRFMFKNKDNKRADIYSGFCDDSLLLEILFGRL